MNTYFETKQVHSLCVDSRPSDRLRLAKGPPPHPLFFFFCQAQSEAHGPPSAMAVRKICLTSWASQNIMKILYLKS